MIYKNLGSEIPVAVPELHAITGYGTTSYKFNFELVHVFKKICKKLSKSKKILFPTIIYTGMSNKNYLSTRVHLNENLNQHY